MIHEVDQPQDDSIDETDTIMKIILSDEEKDDREFVLESDDQEDEDNQNENNNFQRNHQQSSLDEVRNLRDRKSIKRPARYEANFVEVDTPTSYEEAMSCENANHWRRAVDEELKAHELNGTWTYEDLPNGKKLIGFKWVFKKKDCVDGRTHQYKARLCAKGFTQKPGVDFQEIFAPVARYDSIRLMLALAAQEDMQIGQFDVKTVFLNGDLEEELYMKVPDGIKITCESKVCRLRKSLYGVLQASRTWNRKFDSFLNCFRFVPSKADACVYVGNFEASKVYLIIYVDDGLILTFSRKALDVVLNELKLNFRITFGNARNYVGIEIERNVKMKSIFIHQAQYTKRLLQRFNMLDSKVKAMPVNPGAYFSSSNNNKEDMMNIPYRQAIGCLMFLSNVTRPDITYIVNYLSRYVTCYDKEHWIAVKTVFRYLRGTINYGILYNGLCEDKRLCGFSDSDYAGDLDTRRSTTGYLFTLAGGAITWGSIRQRTVALSTTEAEYMAVCEAVKEAIWLKQLLHDNGYPYEEPTMIKVDNQSAIKLIRNPEFHKRSKHMDVRYHFVREKYVNKDIDIEYVFSQEQLADILTKPLSQELFCILRRKIGMFCES